MEMRRRVVIASPGRGATQTQPMLTPTESSLTATSVTSSTPMIPKSSFSGRGRSKVGEAVGGTAAVVCCCPCTVINLAVLAVYKVPSGLCKRAWNKKKRLQKRRLLKKKNGNSSESNGPWPVGLGIILSSDDEGEDERDGMKLEDEKLEEEMWGQFYGGFWRSPSQKGHFD